MTLTAFWKALLGTARRRALSTATTINKMFPAWQDSEKENIKTLVKY